MNKLAKFALAASAAFIAFSAYAYDDIKANKPYSGYAQDTSGVIVRSGFGLCWHTGYYTPADAVPGCDGPIAVPVPPPPPAPAAPEPAPAPPPAPAPAPEPAPAPAPVPVSEKVSFAADAFFDTGKSIVKPEGKAKLDELTSHLQGVNLEAIIATGYTDSVGSDKLNEKLSVRRAEAVKAYIVSKGIDASRVYTEGKGKNQPVADNKTAEGRAKNRRVEIELVGTHTVMK